jgi:hypothetical protein
VKVLRFFGVLLAILVAIFLAGAILGQAMFYLPFGWWHFLERNIPQMTYNWNLIATGAICSVILIVLGHRLGRRLFQPIQISPGTFRPSQPWRWRWTLCIYGAIWLLFMIACGATGLMHQTAWLMEYEQPWYRPRIAYFNLSLADRVVSEVVEANHKDVARTRRQLLTIPQKFMTTSDRSSDPSDRRLIEDFNVIFYGDKYNEVAGYLITPRNPLWSPPDAWVASFPGRNLGLTQFSNVQSAIAELDAKFPTE